ncbi:MFS transporter [Virgibacillus ihumii]|uniref:MFS transporter n=1 Tax=Virgibacillus ihumii TaxID=2686091 RepID=UPI00157DCAAC|nr:MFS transporter [Virgibacillus ihumii]
MEKATIFGSKRLSAWNMLICLFILQILVALIGRSISPLGIVIGEDLSLSKTQIGLLPAAFYLGQSITSIPMGLLTDSIGSKKMIILVTYCLGLSFMGATFTGGLVLLLVLLFISGAGYGAMQPTSNRGVLYWFSTKTRGTAMGMKQMGVTLGSALSALILLPLSNSFGWRPTIFVASIVLMVFGTIAFFYYSEPSSIKKQQTLIQPKSIFSSFISVFKQKTLILISMAAMALCSSQLILNTYIVLFAYEQLQLSIFLSGILLVISEISGSLGRIGWGMISDKIFKGERVIALIIIAVISGIASLTIAFLPQSTPFSFVIGIIIIFGFCISGFNGIWMNAATEIVPREKSGAASGISLMLGTMGIVFGPPIFGYIVETSTEYMFGWLYLTSLTIIATVLLSFALKLSKTGNK